MQAILDIETPYRRRALKGRAFRRAVSALSTTEPASAGDTLLHHQLTRQACFSDGRDSLR